MADFNIAVEKTIKNEGGFTDDPQDRGGITKYGISKNSYPELDIKNLTLDKAKEIYRKDYWDIIKGDEINSQSIANKLFDFSVNTGCHHGIKCIQMALYDLGNEITIDGQMGNETLATINKSEEQVLLNKFQNEAAEYYTELNNPKYIKGWISRLYS